MSSGFAFHPLNLAVLMCEAEDKSMKACLVIAGKGPATDLAMPAVCSCMIHAAYVFAHACYGPTAEPVCADMPS